MLWISCNMLVHLHTKNCCIICQTVYFVSWIPHFKIYFIVNKFKKLLSILISRIIKIFLCVAMIFQSISLVTNALWQHVILFLLGKNFSPHNHHCCHFQGPISRELCCLSSLWFLIGGISRTNCGGYFARRIGQCGGNAYGTLFIWMQMKKMIVTLGLLFLHRPWEISQVWCI